MSNPNLLDYATPEPKPNWKWVIAPLLVGILGPFLIVVFIRLTLSIVPIFLVSLAAINFSLLLHHKWKTSGLAFAGEVIIYIWAPLSLAGAILSLFFR